MADKRVEEAIGLIKAGRRSEGGTILEAELRADPYDVRAWLWLTETRGPIAEKIMILEACLRHNPGTDIAAKALAQLKAQAKDGQNFTAQPAKPAAQAAKPTAAAQPAKPAAQPARPTAQPATAQPAKPVAQPVQSAKPAAQAVKPVAQAAKPTARPAKRAAQPAKPAHGPKDTYKGEHFAVEAYDGFHRFYFPAKVEASVVVVSGLATVMLCGLAPVAAFAMSKDAVAVLCLGALFVGMGGFMAMELIWQFAGEDVLEVSDREVRVKHSLVGLGPSRRYGADVVRRLVLVAPPKSQAGNWVIAILMTVVSLVLGGRFAVVPRFNSRFFSFRRGRLAVVFAKRGRSEDACLFGSGLSDAEAAEILALVRDLYPRLSGG